MRPMSVLVLAIACVLACPPTLAADGIDKVNGSIHAAAGREYGDLGTVNGSIRIDANVRAGEASTVNGGITLGRGASTGELETVNGAIRAEPGVRIQGGVSTVNGDIFVGQGGEIRGDVRSVSGSIGLVQTAVAGSVGTVGGNVTIGAGSHVHGGLRVEKPSNPGWLSFGRQRVPRIIIGANARVDGPLVFERPVTLYVHESARVGAITGATATRYSGARPPAD